MFGSGYNTGLLQLVLSNNFSLRMMTVNSDCSKHVLLWLQASQDLTMGRCLFIGMPPTALGCRPAVPTQPLQAHLSGCPAQDLLQPLLQLPAQVSPCILLQSVEAYAALSDMHYSAHENSSAVW